MANCVTNWVFRRSKFCCCLPARLGASLLAFLTILASGLLMVILWFEVDTNYFMSNKEKIAFIVAGLLETFLFIASVLGFIGTCARKQSFVAIYAIFLYVHFLINVGVAAYFLWMVLHTANEDIVKLCQEGIRNTQAEGQCTGLLNITKNVYLGVTLLILAVEAYCAIVVTRYVNQLRYEKRDIRRSRLEQRQSAYDAFHARFTSDDGFDAPGPDGKRYSALSGSGEDLEMDKEGLLGAPQVTHFDPYSTYDPHGPSPLGSPLASPAHDQRSASAEAAVQSHRRDAERQLTGGSESNESVVERGRNSQLSLPPGAAPASAPASKSRESSISAPHSPPPSYSHK